MKNTNKNRFATPTAFACLAFFLLVTLLAHSASAEVEVEWIRQLGASDWDDGQSVSADTLGNVYITGYTESDLNGTNAGSYDVFVSKYDDSGTLLWTEQLGTSSTDQSYGVSADTLGNVYVSGYTAGDFSGINAGSHDAFVSKYNDSGTLLWTEQLGTSGHDDSLGISADMLGNVFITGYTNGDLGGTNAGSQDAFISKYDDSGTLLWTEQLGSSSSDVSYGVSADTLGNVYISGITLGDLDGTNAGNSDAFVSKYDDSGTLVWTEQLGTSSDDRSFDISADTLGNVYITGLTGGDLGGTSAGGADAFVSKYDDSGTLVWTEQLGTNSSDVSFGVSADTLGNVYISGYTAGDLNGTNAGNNDAFVSKYNDSGTLLWTEQLGTSSYDYSYGVSTDTLGNVYITGQTYGNLGGTNAGGSDIFLAKIVEFNPMITVDPNSLGATDVVRDPSGAATLLTNPVANPLDLGGDELAVGNTGTGELLVIDGADISSHGVFIAKEAGSTGTVTVDGTGATWTSSHRLRIGNEGNGTLYITNGGNVSNADSGYIAADVGSIGTVSVDGAGSTWTNSINLFVGNMGTGTLDITDGGSVLSTTGWVGNNAGSTGTVTVDGDGSTWTNSDHLHVGYNGNGTLNILNGGSVSNNASAVIGYWGDATGSVTVDGANSTWINNSSLYVGNYGTGTLTIQNGGTVTNTGSNSTSFIGAVADSMGTVTVDGTGSTWTNAGDLDIGRDGTGILNITDGGSVSDDYGYIGRETDSTGTVTVDGVGSTWAHSNILAIGHSGNGTLNILDGGVVTNAAGRIANNSGSVGVVTVNGAGSQWNNDDLFVGYQGDATLNIEAGGIVSNTKGYIGNVSGVGEATVTGTGSQWNNFDELIVGRFGDGTLNIEAGGTVTNTNGYLGYFQNRIGTATVAGAGSAWTNSGHIYIGHEGSGTLNIQNEASASNVVGVIAHLAGSTGTATIDGVGSTWTNSAELFVGHTGNGTLNIQSGGSVINTSTTQYGQVAYETGSTGTVNVTGSGSAWTLASNLYIGRLGTANLNVSNGGNASNTFGFMGRLPGSHGTATIDGAGSTWTNSDELYVGYEGTGTLNITDGGMVSSSNGIIGHSSSGVGTATIGGADSTWTNSNDMYVGHDGTGTLNIQNGATVTNTVGYLGAFTAGKMGTATVDGANSSWANSSNLFVGRRGDGSLTITNGGSVSNTEGSIGRFDTSTGTATVDGSGSLWTNTDRLLVGVVGDGTLNIANGGTVDVTGDSFISVSSGSTSSVTVTGAGSTWANSANLYVGGGSGSTGGSGTLNITSDGAVTVANTTKLWGGGTLYLDGGTLTTSSYGNTNGGTWNFTDGEMIIDGGTFDQGVADLVLDGATATDNPTLTLINGASTANLSSNEIFVGNDNQATLNIRSGSTASNRYGIIGHDSTSTGVVAVTGSGSQWHNSFDLSVGNFGNGTLNVEAGGEVSNLYGRIGSQSGSTGVATVTGSGSVWDNLDDLLVGNHGHGTLNIEAGGLVVNAYGRVGHDLDSTGMATVIGTDSHWDNVNDLSVGNLGDGTLNVEAGGVVSNTLGYVGNEDDSTGTVTVDGQGSTWTNSSTLYVGYKGDGSLTIQNGGSVASNGGFIAHLPDSASSVTVDGMGSTWTNSSELHVGDDGDGTLNVEAGGVVSNTIGSIGVNSGSTSIATVTGSGSQWNNSDSLYVGGNDITAGGTGTLNITSNGAVAVTNTTRLWSGGTLNLNGGKLTTGSFDNTGGGAFNWTDGTLSVGTYLGNLTQDAGTLAAGASPGTTVITGDYTLESGGILEIEIAGTGGVAGTDFDFYDIAGAANLGGLLDIRDLEGYLGAVGQTFDVLTASTIDLTGSTFLARPEFSLSTIAGGNGSILRLTQDTELAYNWITLTGGNFQTGANWDASTVPGESHTVRFDTPGETYTVDFTADATNLWAVFENGDTTLDLNGQTYTLSSTGSGTQSLVVGYGLGDSATLTVADGTMNTQYISLGENSSAGALNLGVGTNVSSVTTTLGTGGTLNLNGGTFQTGSFDNTNGGVFVFSDGELIVISGTLDQGGTHLGIGDSTPTTSATLTLTDGATASNIASAYIGNGTFNIKTSSSGFAESTTIGSHLGTTGMLVIDGNGSSWNNSGSTSVGHLGNGTLNITNSGNMSNNNAYIGNAIGVTGTAIIDGNGSTWSNSGELFIGYSGNGTLNITDSGSVSNTNAYVGYDAGTIGAVTVEGVGALWNNSGSLYVGYGGNGTMNVEAGGTVDSTFGVINNYFNSTSVATVAGSGSQWNNSSELYVGNQGTGALNIEAGGLVSNTTGYLGRVFSSTGVATVTGSGSQWNNSSELYVGNQGTGALNVEAGGLVSNTTGYIGYQSGSTGVVRVTGSGTQWNNTESLAIGGKSSSAGGNATLTVQAGGEVNVGTFVKVWSQGHINLANGMIKAAQVEFVDSSLSGFGTVNAEVFGNPELNVFGGVLTLGDGSSSEGYSMTGATAISSTGTLEILDSDSAEVGKSTTLNGGALLARNGVNLGVGDMLSGYGIVIGNVTGLGNNQLAVQPLGIVDFRGTLMVGDDTAIIYSQGRPKINGTLTFNGGGLVTPAGELLVGGHGAIRGVGDLSGIRYLGDLGSTVESQGGLATGPTNVLALGDINSVSGFYSNGSLKVQADAVLRLEDANSAVLDSGASVELGLESELNAVGTGTARLEAANGLTLDFGGNITGYGAIDTPDNAATPFINNGHIAGDSLAEPITLAGYVKGVGTFDNVVITGTDAPGFSPATVNRGSVSYDGTLEIELGGESSGQFDQLNHILGAGIADLGGDLDILLINGFEPTAGDQFELLTATGGVTGMFDSVELPSLDAGLLWELDYNTNEVLLSVIAADNPADFDLDGDVDGDDLTDPTLGWQVRYGNDLNGSNFLTWQREFGSGVSTLAATQAAVPEPGTALLIAMAVACCVCWRRK